MNVHGHCLCGKVEFEIKILNKFFNSCHCSMCRLWSGGPSLSVDTMDGIHFTSDEYIKIYNSSEWAERGFCNQCGTHLFYKLKNGTYCNVPLGLLKNQSEFKFKSQIFIDHKPNCYNFSNKTEMYTEMEVLQASNKK